MSKRHSRLSSDDGRIERRTTSPSSCEKSPCPSCGQLRLTTVVVDDELRVSICDGCNRGYGVDDSMDAETVAALLVDEEFSRDVRMTAVTCRQCFNNDVHRFVIIELKLDSDPQVLRVRCENCSSVSDVPLKDWASDRSENGDDTRMAEVLGNMRDRDEDDGGSLGSGDDSGYVVDSEDDYDICIGLDDLPFSCGCGNSEVDCFEKHFDPASRDLSRVKCLACDDEKVVDAFFGVECGHCENNRKELFERRTDDYGRTTFMRCLACDRLLYPRQPASRSLWNGDDSGYIVDSEDEYDIGVGLDDLPFSCGCGNSEVDCFEKHFDPASGDLSRVKCLACNDEKVVDAFFGVECGHCENDRRELFERHIDDYGRTTFMRCLVCDRILHCPGQPAPRKAASEVGMGRTKIADLCQIQRGDHVAWHRRYAIWHHAIVVDVPVGGRTLTVIHNSGDIIKLDGHFASVRLETLDINPKKEDFYRIDYPKEDIHPVDEVVKRACSRLGEAKYNPATNNCEHFARWCKTGCAQSGQVCTFIGRLFLVGQSAVAKATQEAAADGVESLVARSLSTVVPISRAGQVFGATSGIVRNIKCGTMACNFAITLALEAYVFGKDVLRAYRKYKSGAISRDEFRRLLSKNGCESVGGLISGSSMGIAGQVLIPVPIVGGIVGCTVGSLIGRYIGALIGKKLGAIKN